MIDVASIVAPARVDAHDPGQGSEITSVTIRATVTGNEVVIEAHDLDSRFDLQPKRDRGATRRSDAACPTLIDHPGMGWTVELDREGRFLVSVTALVDDAADGSLLEAWIPVIAGTNQVDTKQTMMYRPAGQRSSPWQIAAGVLIGATSRDPCWRRPDRQTHATESMNRTDE